MELILNAPTPSCCSDPRHLCPKCKARALETHPVGNRLTPLELPRTIEVIANERRQERDKAQPTQPTSKPGEPLLIPVINWNQKG